MASPPPAAGALSLAAPGPLDLLDFIGPREGLGCVSLGDGRTLLSWGGQIVVRDPLRWPEELREALAGLPAGAGLLGWIGYEAGAAVERMPPCAAPSALVRLWRVDGALVHEASTGRWQVRGAAAFREEARELLGAAPPSRPPLSGPRLAPEPPPGTADHFQEAVRRALGHIASGDLYQVNLAWEAVADCPDPIAAFIALAQHNPARRAALLQREGRTVLSNSPECFLQVCEEPGGSRVTSSPIKGTAARSGGHGALRALERSEKERAELTMIVDLVRNDLGRVALPGTVRPEARRIRACGDLWHAEQHVHARVRPGLDLVDLLAASFPPGSVTGAPKVRAMSLIQELERGPRGVYTGTLGWIGGDGQAELAVAIRTASVEGGRARYHVGAGIVADSEPALEWQETLAKAGALARLLGARRAGS